MMRDRDRRVIERFRDRVRGGDTRGVRVTLRIAGGFPSERLDHRFVLDGDGEARIEVREARDPTAAFARTEQLDAGTAGVLFAEIERRLDRVVSRRDAAFVPGSLIGYATVEVDADGVELVFAPDQSLLLRARAAAAMAPGDLGRRTIMAVQRPPIYEDA